MAQVLHHRQLLKLPAGPGGRAEYRDADTPGLLLRVYPSGKRTFFLEYWRGRSGQHFRLGTVPPMTLAKARAAARDLFARIQLGADPARERRESRDALTVGTLVDRCIKAIDVRDTTRKQYKLLVEARIRPAFGSRDARTLTRGEIRTWAERAAKDAPYQANRALEVLARAYSWAVQKELLAFSPCVGISAPGKERQRERVLSSDELAALQDHLDAAPGAVADVVWLLLLTGARLAMVVEARREELQLDGREPTWTIPAERMKADKPHLVPLSPEAVKVFERRLELTKGAAVFPAPAAEDDDEPMPWRSVFNADIYAGLDEKLERAAEAWVLHSIRHTVATHLREDLRVSKEVVSWILAHAPEGSKATRIYDRSVLLPERRAALKAWARWLQAVRVKDKRKRAELERKILPMAGRGR